MWFDHKETLVLLRRIVARVSADPNLSDDLLQEAVIHFWLQEQREPGNSLSWYLQSCYFRLENYLRRGRSVDSPKHRNGREYFTRHPDRVIPENDGPNGSDKMPDPCGDVLSKVAEREILALLSPRLNSRDQE